MAIFPDSTMCYKDHGSGWKYAHSDHRRADPAEPTLNWPHATLETLILHHG
jgi:hypothetical protein